MTCASIRSKTLPRSCFGDDRSPGSGRGTGRWDMTNDVQQGLHELLTLRLPEMDRDIKSIVSVVTNMYAMQERMEQKYMLGLNRLSQVLGSGSGNLTLMDLDETMKKLTESLEKQNSLTVREEASAPVQLQRQESLLKKVEQVFTDLHVTQQNLTINVADDKEPEVIAEENVKNRSSRSNAANMHNIRNELHDELLSFKKSLDDQMKEQSDSVVQQLASKLEAASRVSPGLEQQQQQYLDSSSIRRPPPTPLPPLPADKPLEVLSQPAYQNLPRKTTQEEKAEREWQQQEQAAEEYDETIVLLEDNSFASLFAIDDDVEKPPYQVEKYYKTEGWPQAVARHPTFLDVTTIIVFINAVWIGIEAQYVNENNIFEAPVPFVIIAESFVVYFTTELVIRFLAFAHKPNALRDGWFRFDLFLVITMVADTIFMIITFAIESDTMRIPTQPFRVLRLLKLTRLARLARAIPELITMVKGLIRSLRAIASTIILVVLMDYVWALLLHMLLKDEHEFNETIYRQSFLDFTTVGRCMWALIMNGTLLLDNSSPLMTQMLFNKRYNIVIAGLLFCFFVFMTAILILQMLIGVLCDLVARLNDEQQESAAIGLVKQELLVKLKELDEDNDGMVSHSEVVKLISKGRSRAVMKKMGINELFLLQMLEMFFSNSQVETISYKSALQLILLCREEQATTIKAFGGGVGYLAREIKGLREENIDRWKSFGGQVLSKEFTPEGSPRALSSSHFPGAHTAGTSQGSAERVATNIAKLGSVGK